MKDLYFLLTKDVLVYGITDIESFSWRIVIISKCFEKTTEVCQTTFYLKQTSIDNANKWKADNGGSLLTFTVHRNVKEASLWENCDISNGYPKRRMNFPQSYCTSEVHTYITFDSCDVTSTTIKQLSIRHID